MKKSPVKHKTGATKRAGGGSGAGKSGPSGKSSMSGQTSRLGKSSTSEKTGRPGKGEPMREDDVQDSNDEHIDQDLPGYPHHPAKTIHNGSAGAFDATEHSHDEDDEDQDNDDFAMDR